MKFYVMPAQSDDGMSLGTPVEADNAEEAAAKASAKLAVRAGDALVVRYNVRLDPAAAGGWSMAASLEVTVEPSWVSSSKAADEAAAKKAADEAAAKKAADEAAAKKAAEEAAAKKAADEAAAKKAAADADAGEVPAAQAPPAE